VKVTQKQSNQQINRKKT